MLRSLIERWFRRGPRRPDVSIVMYTRQGCHLCEDAWAILTRHQRRSAFRLEQIDVDKDPDLVAQYGNCVPVVLVNRVLRFRGRVNEVLLQRILNAIS